MSYEGFFIRIFSDNPLKILYIYIKNGVQKWKFAEKQRKRARKKIQPKFNSIVRYMAAQSPYAVSKQEQFVHNSQSCNHKQFKL